MIILKKYLYTQPNPDWNINIISHYGCLSMPSKWQTGEYEIDLGDTILCSNRLGSVFNKKHLVQENEYHPTLSLDYGTDDDDFIYAISSNIIPAFNFSVLNYTDKEEYRCNPYAQFISSIEINPDPPALWSPNRDGAWIIDITMCRRSIILQFVDENENPFTYNNPQDTLKSERISFSISDGGTVNNDGGNIIGDLTNKNFYYTYSSGCSRISIAQLDGNNGMYRISVPHFLSADSFSGEWYFEHWNSGSTTRDSESGHINFYNLVLTCPDSYNLNGIPIYKITMRSVNS